MSVYRDFGLGRLEDPDARDFDFPMAAGLPPQPSERTERYWFPDGAWFDQGRTSSCVGHAWAHWVEDGPILQPNYEADPFWVYREAQRIDRWPGKEPQMKGSSVRAGAKVLQAKGIVASYHWAFDIDTVVEALLELGPVIVGTRWYVSMYKPDNDGIVRVVEDTKKHQHAGHAYLLNGVDRETALIRIKNSWGRHWGQQGHAFISFEDFEKLIKQNGEICIASENELPRAH